MAKYGKKAGAKVERAMKERKKGTLKSGRSGKKVISRKQAIAIGLSEARKAGAKVPKKKAASKKSATKKSSTKKSQHVAEEVFVAATRLIPRGEATGDLGVENRSTPRSLASLGMTIHGESCVCRCTTR